MLGILFLLSCLGGVLSGGIEVAGPFVQDATRTSIAYGNSEFLARYGFGAPFGGAAITAPYVSTFHDGLVGAPFAAHLAHSAVATPVAGIASPFLAARTAVAAPGVAVSPVAAVTPAPVAGIASPFLAARTAVAAPAIAAGPIAAVTAAPIATVTAAPITAHAAVAAPYAAIAAPVASAPLVSTFGHVQGVAQVPVTKIEAQPALIQNVVDVANTKIASRKFEIRRPAIKKDFYDVEERVVVRPAGSAVVELDQPISKTQRGPTVVTPAPESLEPVVASAPIRGLPIGHAVHGQAIFPSLAAVPVHSYPIQGAPLQPVFPSVGVTPVPIQPVRPSTPRPVLPDVPEADDTESISVENPELGRARIGQQQQRQGPGGLNGEQIQRIFEQSRAQAEARAQQEIQARAKILAEEREQLEIQARARAQAEERTQQEILARARAQADQRAQQEIEARSRIQAQQQIIEQQQLFEHQQQQLLARLRSQQVLQQPAPVRENVEIASRSGEVRQGGNIASGLVRISAQAEEIPSVRNFPEVEQANQARLIALLTERGPVSEVRSGNGFDGRVRARVLSATPAPFDALPQDEKVNTRRVVVNRPIQTVQEVDVVEPFTKIERVAVQQPALIKTARLGVANVPTAVPVHSYTHAHYAF